MGKFIKNWKKHGRPFSGQRLRDNLKGMAPDYIEKRIAERVENLDKARNVGTIAIKSIVSGTPLLGNVGRLLDKVPVLRKFPVIKQIALEGVAVAQGAPVGSLLSDFIPAWQDFKKGDYKAAGLSLVAGAVTTGFIVWILAKCGVTLPAWVIPTILDLINSAATEAAYLLQALYVG